MAFGATTQVPQGKDAKSTQKNVEVPSDAQEIFEEHSSIGLDQVSKHVLQIVAHLPHS